MKRFIIADDHSIVRRGIREIIQDAYPEARIEEAGDAETLLHLVSQQPPDLVITDLSMPGRSGLDAIQQIRQMHPRLPVIVLSMYPEDQYAVRALKSGASGYLNKETAPDELVNAVRQVLQGKKYITGAVAEKLYGLLTTGSQPPYQLLSDREFEVFKQIAGGKSISQIAEQLSLSATTISTYRARILEKLDLKTNADLTRYAMEMQLL
ncbi:MAG TPA: response regulator transcription factor [Chitinophagaceae bacterium]